MTNEEIVLNIFPDHDFDLETTLKWYGSFDIHEDLLIYGLKTKQFLYIDYKGEEYQEIINFILNYEFMHQIELATKNELKHLERYDYEFLPEKIIKTNEILSSRGYGLFSYPNSGDFHVLFISRLDKMGEILQEELLLDDRIPTGERYIKYYR
jgi:hypothetical protein